MQTFKYCYDNITVYGKNKSTTHGTVQGVNEETPGTAKGRKKSTTGRISGVGRTMNFEDQVTNECNSIRELLLRKNKAYGNSALEPVRVFSKATPTEQILVRIDDKLSRLQRGNPEDNEDTVQDLIGYLILLRISRLSDGDAILRTKGLL